jgi:ABC-type nickel/cobalt efflux system permease component RcnA
MRWSRSWKICRGGVFLARRGKWWHGVSLGFSITMIHTMSAVILLFVLFLLARAMVFSYF